MIHLKKFQHEIQHKFQHKIWHKFQHKIQPKFQHKSNSKIYHKNWLKFGLEFVENFESNAEIWVKFFAEN